MFSSVTLYSASGISNTAPPSQKFSCTKQCMIEECGVEEMDNVSEFKYTELNMPLINSLNRTIKRVNQSRHYAGPNGKVAASFLERCGDLACVEGGEIKKDKTR